MHADVLIAGAGQAGGQVALCLRQRGFAGSITMVGAEAFPPYERPPLSKDYLAGKRDTARLFLRKPEGWSERQVELRLGRTVLSVDPGSRRVALDDGTQLSYGWLVWATGGRPRPLTCEGAGLAGVHMLRTIADIDRLRQDLLPGRRVAIVGGGFVGLETAASLRTLGHEVVVLEAQDRLLARVTAGPVSDFFLGLHLGNGVDVRLGAVVTRLTGRDRVEGVELAGGEVLPADLVIVGIGIVPNVEPLVAAGLDCPNGVLVDALCRTADPRILAIGDCALHPNGFASGLVRLESVQNATDQAKLAAEVIAGTPAPYAALPWFWSDQYDVKMQTVGLCAGHDRLVVRGDRAAGRFSVAYLRAGHLIALDCVNSPKDFVQGRTLVTSGAAMDQLRLADAGVSLRDAVAEPVATP